MWFSCGYYFFKRLFCGKKGKYAKSPSTLSNFQITQADHQNIYQTGSKTRKSRQLTAKVVLAPQAFQRTNADKNYVL